MKKRILLILIFSLQFFQIVSFAQKTYVNDTIILNPLKQLSQQIKKNEVYVVQDTFDLKGEKINLPANTVFVFKGGTIRNGFINARGSIIINITDKRIFDKSILLSGNWHETVFYPEWFGAAGDGKTDDTEALQRMIDCASKVYLTGVYKVSHLIINHSLDVTGGCLKAFLDEYGNTRNIIQVKGHGDFSFSSVLFDGSGSLIPTKGELEPMISVADVDVIKFNNCSFFNHSQNSGLRDEPEWQNRRCYAVSILCAKNVTFKACTFHDNLSEQVAIGSNSLSDSKKPITKLLIEECKSYNNENALALFLFFNLKSAVIYNNTFSNNGRAFFNLLTNNIVFRNNTLINTKSRAITSESHGDYYSADNIIIESNVIINAKEGAISVGGKNVIIKGNQIELSNEPNDNVYIIRVGGKILGDNSFVQTVNKALPYYKNKQIKDNVKRHVEIVGNIINGYAKRSAIMIRSTETIATTNEVVGLGRLKKISIKNNTISVIGGTPIYFSNGHYEDVFITNNKIKFDNSVPVVYISPSSYSKNVKSSLNRFTFENNLIEKEGDPILYLIEMGYGSVNRIKVNNNNIEPNMVQKLFQLNQE